MRVFSAAFISLQVFVLIFLSSTDQTVEALSIKGPGAYIDDVRGYLIKVVNDRLISKSSMVGEFKETINIISERYATEKAQLPMDATEQDASSLYYKIVADELRGLRERLEKKKAEKIERVDDFDDATNEDEGLYDGLPVAADKFLKACTDCAQQIPEEDPNDDEENLELTNQLNDLESLEREESEMGWSLSPENRALLQQRTRQIVGELIQNEVRQIAFAILTSYMTGSPLAPIVLAVSSTIKLKLINYLLNSIMDVLASILGKKVEDLPPIASSPQLPVIKA